MPSQAPAKEGQRSSTKDNMRISARNWLQGKIVEVTKGATTAHVKIDVGGANA